MGLFSGKEVKEFAIQLAAEVARRYSPAMEKGEDRKISAKGISNILEEAYQKAVDFKREQRLGFIRTAKLGNTFRWELKELGYSESFVEVVTEGLIVYLTRKPGAINPGSNVKPQKEKK